MMNAALKVADAHEKVDQVERALRLRFPSVVRAIGHAEPLTAGPLTAGP
jgi:divalent metal cation (Fe/Co/Zn/Cd) transporter